MKKSVKSVKQVRSFDVRYLQSVVLVLQVFDAESLSFNLLSQQRRVDHLDAGACADAGHHVRCRRERE